MDDLKQLDRPPVSAGYETDFYAWALDQATRIRALAMPGLDTENVAEEIESLGRRDKRALRSRLEVLLVHLLKWQFQPQRRGKSWSVTILKQRHGIEIVLQDSPSLRRMVPTLLVDSYPYIAAKAASETNLPPETFPASCQWTPEQIIDKDWLPD